MEPKAAEASEKAGAAFNAYDWIESLVSAVVICILIFIFFLRVVNVQGYSMEPTLYENQKIVITRLAGDYHRGDIVVLTKLAFDDESIVKRVIATAGETVDIDFDEGIVYVDGQALDEPYTASLTTKALDFSGPVTVPEGCVFCLGDNRNHSTDSRRKTIGMIDKRCILGKVILRLWPLAAFGVPG